MSYNKVKEMAKQANMSPTRFIKFMKAIHRTEVKTAQQLGVYPNVIRYWLTQAKMEDEQEAKAQS